MGINQIGYVGQTQLNPRINFQHGGVGAQVVGQVFGGLPITLQNGQAFLIPPGQWEINAGRYTQIQYFDSTAFRWRTYGNWPGQLKLISSDGTNFRLINSTGTPVGAVITNVGAGNATNGYNTVTVAPSTGNSSWGTLVGGTLNTTVTVTASGNFSLPPVLVWTPAGNQTFPFLPPSFYCNMSGNNINTVTVQYPGAGLTAAGTLTAVNSAGDTNPGVATITLNATLTNSGNLTAMWPLTQGNAVTSVPTFTFTGTGSGWAATAIMNFVVSNITSVGGLAGGNLGVSKPIMITAANAIVTATQNTVLTGNDYAVNLVQPRMPWLTGTSDANGNFNGNTTVTVIDGGFGIQAVPNLVAIPSNMNGVSTNSWPVFTAQVGGSPADTSFLQAI